MDEIFASDYLEKTGNFNKILEGICTMTATVLEFKCPTCGHLLGERGIQTL